jgi:murein DD-endopeptidase MepM/ murein hydrolase activator NlpD
LVRRVIFLAGVTAVLMWVFTHWGEPPVMPEHVVLHKPPADGATVYCLEHDELARGESLYDLLIRRGVSPRQALEAGAALKHVMPPNLLRAGDRFSFFSSSDSVLSLIRLERSALECFELAAQGESFQARALDIDVDTLYRTVRGLLTDNLWTSFIDAGAPPPIIVAFTEIFAWSVDFFREARPGDVFAVRFSELQVDGKGVGTGDIEGAYYIRNTGDTLWAVAFREKGQTRFYDEKGQSLRKALLRAPLKFSRVSSGFNGRRFHPVYRTFKPHNGVDYSANRGTPVYAAGDGQIRFAGTKRGLGKCVEIRHPNGYRTVYGHLSRISRGVTTGAHVEQKQQIGKVGSTGNATGPHLHYEVWHGRKAVNPRALKLPAKGPVPEALRADFQKYRDALIQELAPVYGPLLASQN